MSLRPTRNKAPKTLPKSLTGIGGLDILTGGGLPTGRPTLVCGNAGCGIKLLDAGGDALVSDDVFEFQSGDRQDGVAVGVDNEGTLIGAMNGSAVFDDAQAPGGNLIFDTMIQQNHAIGNIFFQ